MAIALRLLFENSPPHVGVALAQPLPVVDGWGGFGAAAFAALAAAIGVAAIAYLRIVGLGPGVAGLRSAWKLAALTAFALACAWAVPAIFSSDVYAYAAYGKLLLLGGNPWGHVALPYGVAIFDAAIVQWGNPPPACVYGPLFVGLAAAVVWLTSGLGTFGALAGLRLVASAALVACAVLAFAAYSGDRRARLAAAATIALNPAAIWSAAEGHNDAFALAIVLAGVVLARRGRPGIGAFVAALAGAVKLPAMLGGLAVTTSRLGRAGAALGAAAVLAVSLPLFAGIATHVAPHAVYAPQASFQALVAAVARVVLPAPSVTLAAWGLATLAAAGFAWKAWSSLRLGGPEGWGYAALGGWLLVPNPYPWYGLWLAAIAAVMPGTRVSWVLLGLTLASVLRYLPDAVFPAAPPPDPWIALGAMLPFLLLLAPRRAPVLV